MIIHVPRSRRNIIIPTKISLLAGSLLTEIILTFWRTIFLSKKIDRVLANWAWRELFPHALATTHPIVNSDHAPIILKPIPPHRSGTNFRYEDFWEDSEECREIVANAWNSKVEAEDTWGTCQSYIKAL